MAVTKRQNKAKKAENKNASVRVCSASSRSRRRPGARIFAMSGPALLPVSVLHAHKGIVDRGRLIKSMARIAVCGLAARWPAVRIEGELVMPHWHYVTLRAFWLDGRVRRRLRGRRNP